MILYHYCSTAAFFNIVKKKKIWLSSLSASNDTHEGKWLHNVVARYCARRGVDPVAAEQLLTMVGNLCDVLDGLGFCLSTKEDMLSQWRGYADDGAGVAIAFHSDLFDQMAAENRTPGWPLRLVEVEYDDDNQERLVEPYIESALAIAGLDLVRPDGEFSTQKEAGCADAFTGLEETFRQCVFDMFELTYRIKNGAFEEEQEHRFLQDCVTIEEGGLETKFRLRGERLVPYREIRFQTRNIPPS